MTDLSLPPTAASALLALPAAHLPDAAALLAKPLPALRNIFNQWIRSLPMEERFLAVKVHCPPLPHLLRALLARSDAPWPTRTDPADQRKPIRKCEKNIYDSLVLVSDGQDYLDHICFDYALLECPERLFDLLASSLDDPAARPLALAQHHPLALATVALRLETAAHRDEAAGTITDYLRQEVLGRFMASVEAQDFISGQLEEEKRRKKDFSLHWKYLSEDLKQRLLLLGHPDTPALALSLALPPADLQREMEELLRLQKNDFCNRVFKCKLKKATLPMVDYYELLYSHWKKEMEKNKRRRVAKHMRAEKEHPKLEDKSAPNRQKPKKQRKSTSVESSETNVTEVHQKQENQEVKVEKQPEMEIDLSKLFEKKEETRPKKKGRNKPKPKAEETKKEKRTQPARKNSINPQWEDKQETQSPKLQNLLSIYSTNPSQAELPMPKPIDPAKLREISLLRLSEQLQQASDHISEQANQYHERRIIAFQRLQFLLQYYNIPIKLFGSCASGIAIKNSDIDIAIDNSLLAHFHYLPEQERVRAALDRLVELFETQPWIAKLKFIRTAAIPVIKLIVDTALPCFHPSCGPAYQQLNRPHQAGPIEADISVQTLNQSQECNHLGLITTATIQKWLESINSLHYMVILTKQLFAKQRLNITYEGGLNTFAMIVLMVAYVMEHKLEEENNPALVLERILKFYAYEFDEKTTGIDLSNHGISTIYYQKQNVPLGSPRAKQQADLQMKDPLNQQANMSRNCYLFPVIKKLFADLLQKCFQDSHREVEALLKDEAEDSLQVLEGKVKEKLGGRNKFSCFLESGLTNF